MIKLPLRYFNYYSKAGELSVEQSSSNFKSMISYNDKKIENQDLIKSIERNLKIMDFRSVDKDLNQLFQESSLSIDKLNEILSYEHMMPLKTLKFIFNYILVNEIALDTISYHYIIRFLLKHEGFLSAYRVMLNALNREVLIDYSTLSILYEEALMTANNKNRKKQIFSIKSISLMYFGKEQTDRLNSLDKIIEELKIENLIEENVDNEDFDLTTLSSKNSSSKTQKPRFKSEVKIPSCICKCYLKVLKNRSRKI